MMLSWDEEESCHLGMNLPTIPVGDELPHGSLDAASSSGSGSSPRQPFPLPQLQQGELSQSAKAVIEPIAIGYSGGSHRLERSSSLQSMTPTVIAEYNSFPAISSSFPAMHHARSSINEVSGPESPVSVKSAWSAPLHSSPSSPGSTGHLSKTSRAVIQRSRPQHEELIRNGLRSSDDGKVETQEERDLRYAIELSLAEARSLGEDI